MKKLITICFVAVFVLAVSSPVQSATLEVRPPGGTGILGDVYTSIQQAIDAAGDGDTLTIHPGTYTEQLSITGKGLTIQGTDESTVIVQAAASPNFPGNVFTIDAAGKNITIQNITIRHGNYGLRSTNGNVNVLQCTFYHNGWDGDPGYDPNTFYDYTTTSDGGAIRIQSSASTEIAYCTVYENARGIRYQDGDNGSIHNNVAHSNIESGIYLAAGSYCNPPDDDGCTNTDVNDNESYGNMNNGILSIGGKNNTIRNNNIHDNWNTGVMLWCVGENTVQGNTINNNNLYSYNGVGNPGDDEGGVWVESSTIYPGSSYICKILGNTISNTQAGGLAQSVGVHIGNVGADGIDINGNTLTNHDIDIWVENQAATITVKENCFDGSDVGIQNHDTGTTLDATLNAWGDADGPYHPDTNPYASGDQVSDNVDYYQWYPDCTFTTPVYKPVHNVTLDRYYDTIQDAIDDAGDGDTIEVAAGTFTEDVAIDVCVILHGAQTGQDPRGGRSGGESEIVGSIRVLSGVADITVDGFKITGTELGAMKGVCMRIESPNSLIQNNIIVAVDGSGYDYSGIVDLEGITNTTIERNDFSGVYDAARQPNVIRLGVTGPGVVLISQNEMHNVGGGGGIGVMCSNNDAVINIIENEIEGTGDGIWFWDPVSGSFEVNIQSNTIFNCQKKGVKIVSPIGAAAVNCNRIYNNTEEGVYNGVSSLLVDAEYNWWGDASGPGSVGGGIGDEVSDYVDFFPWLLSEDCNDSAQVAADFVVDDDWVGLPNWTTVEVDGTDYYTGLNAFAVIQDAIDAASDGNSISVADGNYPENLVIDKSVQVIGAGGETSLVYSSTGLKLISINVAATSVELAGFTLKHTGDENWGSSYAILVENGAYANIHDNVVADFKKRGIYVQGSDSSADITGNTILGESGATGLQNGIAVWNSAGGFANIINNEVSGGAYTGEDWTGSGILILDTYDKVVRVKENFVYNNQVGIGAGEYCGYNSGAYSADVIIQGNILVDNEYGIDIFNDIRGAHVVGNDISGSAEYAITVTDYNDEEDWSGCAQPNDTVIQYNNIADNNVGLTVNERVAPVNAEYNWWGETSGPADPCGTGETDGLACYDVSTIKNADGLGDSVSERADYCPWLSAAVSMSFAPYARGDVNYDGCVNWLDLAILAERWLDGCE